MLSKLRCIKNLKLIAPYSISKTTLIGMTKAMAPYCAELGIRVNGIAPGVIKTNFSRALWENEDLLKENNECFLKRVGHPDEIAGTAVYLCSDDATYVTGETLIVAGGTNSRL